MLRRGKGTLSFLRSVLLGSRCVGLVSRSWVWVCQWQGFEFLKDQWVEAEAWALVSFSGRKLSSSAIVTAQHPRCPHYGLCAHHLLNSATSMQSLCVLRRPRPWATPLVSAVKARGSAVQLAETWIRAELLPTGSMQECSSPALIRSGCDGWSQTCVCTVAWHNAPASAFEPEVWSSKL